MNETSTPAPFDPSQLKAETFGSPAQLQQFMDAEVQAGHLTREEADAKLRGDGVEPAAPAPEPILVQEGEELSDEAVFPAAKPHEYTLPRLTTEDQPYTREVAAFDKQLRGWLSTAELPKEIGSAVAQAAFRAANGMKDATDLQRDAFASQELAKLERMWGPQTHRRINLANELIRQVEAKNPGLRAYLDESGACYSAEVLAQLGMHAERLAARRRGQ